MNRISFEIEDNALIKRIQHPVYGTYQEELVIDKETFIKCFEAWIKPQIESEDKG